MGGWCSYKIAQLLCRPGPPARSGRRRAFTPSRRPAGPRGAPGPVPPGPQGAQRQPRGLLPRTRGDRAGCGGARQFRVGNRVCANNFEDTGRRRSGSEREASDPAGAEGQARGSLGAGGSPLPGMLSSTGKERVTTNRCSDAGAQHGGRRQRAANVASSARLRALARKGLGGSHSLHVISQTL